MNELAGYAVFLLIIASGLWLLYYNKEWFFSFCIFIIPLSVGISLPGGSKISLPAELLLVLMAAWIVFQSIKQPESLIKIIAHPLSIILTADLLWMIVTSATSEIPLVSFKRVIVRVVYITALFLFCVQWAEKENNKTKYLFLYALGLIIPIAVTEYRHIFMGFNPLGNVELCRPFFDEHTIYGAAIAFVIPFVAVAAANSKIFSLTRIQIIAIRLLLVILVAAEYFSFSRAGFLSLIFSFMMYIFLKLHLQFKHLLICIGCVLLVTFIFKNQLIEYSKTNTNQSKTTNLNEYLLSAANLNSNVSNLERWNRWKCAVRMFKERPILGYGPGTFQFVYGPFQHEDEMTRISTTSGNKGNAHSEFLTGLSESGAPGLILNLFWILTAVWYAMRVYYKTENIKDQKIVMAALLGFTTFIFHGFFNAFMDQDKIAGLVFTSIAMIVACDLSLKRKSSSVAE